MADGDRLPQRRVRRVRRTAQLWPPPRGARGGAAGGGWLHVVECVVPRRASAALAAASPCTYYRLGAGGVSAPYTGHDGGLDLEVRKLATHSLVLPLSSSPFPATNSSTPFSTC